MPLQRCEDDDRPGWRWGEEGKCYTYTAGDDASEREARRKAMAQAVAMGEIEIRQDQGNITTPDSGDLNTEARRYAASRGWAMNDGSYPIRPLDMHGRTDLSKAIRAVGRGGGSHETIRRHIMKRARALGLSDMVPENWTSGGSRSVNGLEIFERSSPAVLEDVNFKDRTIEVIAVPWDEEAEIVWRGETWKEIFERYSLDEAAQEKARVPVNRQHNRADTVGRIVRIDPRVHQRGALASVKVARTPRGDETLQLASEGMLGASVGYFLRKMSDVLALRRTMTRRVQRAFLDHLSMVEDPAYKGAETVAVHDVWTPHPEAGTRSLATPALDEYLADDVLSWAKARTVGS